MQSHTHRSGASRMLRSGGRSCLWSPQPCLSEPLSMLRLWHDGRGPLLSPALQISTHSSPTSQSPSYSNHRRSITTQASFTHV